jgi:hypothetical protein
MRTKYEIINHGYMRPDYFQGWGTAYTDFDYAVTGCGNNAKEAYNDAVEQIYRIHIDGTYEMKRVVEALKLPTRPKGIRAKDKVPESDSESYWYVGIRYNL